MTALRTDVRELDDADLASLRLLLDADPIVNAVITARLAAAGTVHEARLGGRFLGSGGVGHQLEAACYAGGSVAPIGGDARAWESFAARMGSAPRRCSSLIGSMQAVEVLRPILERSWGAARLVRRRQPLLVRDLTDGCGVDPDPDVRPARPDEVVGYLPAAAAMFAEELGATRPNDPGRPGHVDRLAALIAAGRALVKADAHGQVLFKAELAAITEHTCQVQGLWVRPDLRGRGVGTAATAAVLRIALAHAPTVSLYVNDFNVAARRMYARLGMRQVGTLSTVLF